MTRRCCHIAALLAALLSLVSCGEQSMNNHVIAQNEAYYVTGDSVVQGDIVVTAVSPQELTSTLNLSNAEQMLQRMAGADTVPYCLTTGINATITPDDNYPLFMSQQTLVDALYNLAIGDVRANDIADAGYNSHQDHSSLYAAIYLTLALLNPDRAKASLRNQVEEQLVMQKEGTWPVCDDRLAWPIAAWEVYCATGDRQWLNEAYDITLNTLDEEWQVQHDRSMGLLHGGVLTRLRADNYYPDWANAISLTEIETMINNVLGIRALEVANLMAEELGETVPYEAEAQHLRETVNQQLWDENRGRYSAYILGRVAPMQSPLTDNMAQALAVLWDLADDDRASTLIDNTPMGLFGVVSTYPNHSIEPYLENPTWTLTQACWNIAASTVGNEHALRRGLAALYRAQALYHPQHITIDGRHVNTLASAASNIAMVMRVMAGIRLMPDGIEFAPNVPDCLPGNKTLLNLRYRNATLDITLVGCGNDIEQMSVDGQMTESNFIAGDIEGHHNILIKLRHGKAGSQHVTLAAKAQLPPTPSVYWSGDSAFINDWSAQVPYKLVINGARSYSLSDSAFALPPLPALAELCLVTANRYGYSTPSPIQVISSSPAITLQLSDSTLQADTLATHVRVDHAGTYLLNADYSINSGCDIVIIDANGHNQGTLYLPSTGTSPQRSNLIAVQLLRGNNTLTLRRYRIGYRATLHHLTLIP